MKHPLFARNPRVNATIPALSGGLNVGTDKSLIGDTELADVCDMEWKNGALRTRRGFVTDSSRYSTDAAGDRMQFFTDQNGYVLVLTAVENEAGCDLFLTVFDSNGVQAGEPQMMAGQPGLDGFFVAAGESRLQARYAALLFLNTGRVCGIRAHDYGLDELDHQVYEPLYLINGTPASTYSEGLIGDRLEPYNTLTSWYRCTYTPDGEGVFYTVPSVWERGGVTAAYGEWSWSVDAYQSASEQAGDFVMHVDRQTGSVWFEKNGVPEPLPSGARNALTIRAQHAGTTAPSLTTMRFGTWYGGDRSQKAGGTRLFLGGGSHVMWSAPSDPLYFPATAYVSLGDPNEAVTAFGKLGEWLVLFKEHSVYAAEYVRSDDITVSEVQSGAVTDITATAMFPITPIHAEIGCDLPKTVALHDNRLVWACADGTVYALSAGGALSARTISVISAPVRPLLKARVPQVAAGVTDDGVYHLLWDNTLLLLEHDRWTRFSFEHTGAQAVGFCRAGGRVWIPATYRLTYGLVLFWFWQAGEADTRITHTGDSWADAVYVFVKRAVRGMVCTKQFDLGAPDEYKQVTRVFADATVNGAVNASYVTEQGEYADVPQRVTDGVRLTPAVSRCRRLALRLAGEGLCVKSVTFRVTMGRR